MEERVISRATDFQFSADIQLRTCSAEDLIVLKAFADRTRDWADIESILIRQGDGLDTDYVLTYLNQLCVLKEEPQILQRLKQLLGRSE